jgi:hypothetical protein
LSPLIKISLVFVVLNQRRRAFYLSKDNMRLPSSFAIAFIGFGSIPFLAEAVAAGPKRVEIDAASPIVTVDYRCGPARRWVPAGHAKHGSRTRHCVPNPSSATSATCRDYASVSQVQCAQFAVSTEH